MSCQAISAWQGPGSSAGRRRVLADAYFPFFPQLYLEITERSPVHLRQSSDIPAYDQPCVALLRPSTLVTFQQIQTCSMAVSIAVDSHLKF